MKYTGRNKLLEIQTHKRSQAASEVFKDHPIAIVAGRRWNIFWHIYAP
jgi:hypothetical protein